MRDGMRRLMEEEGREEGRGRRRWRRIGRGTVEGSGYYVEIGACDLGNGVWEGAS